MELFVCALHLEATPLIRTLRLKKNLRYREFELFESENSALIVSGIGPLRSAMATTFLLQHAMRSSPERKPFVITNLGIAGSTKGVPLATVCKINKIHDLASGDEFYPILSLKSPLHQLPLISSYRPVSADTMAIPPAFDKIDRLYDMEASGFFLAASRFLSIESLQVLKIVSDHLEPGELSKEIIERLAEVLLPEVIRESQNLHEAHVSFYTSPFSKDDQQLLETMRDELRLTESEQRQLFNGALRYKVLRKEILKTGLLSHIPSTKSEKKKLFRKILQEWEVKV